MSDVGLGSPRQGGLVYNGKHQEINHFIKSLELIDVKKPIVLFVSRDDGRQETNCFTLSLELTDVKKQLFFFVSRTDGRQETNRFTLSLELIL